MSQVSSLETVSAISCQALRNDPDKVQLRRIKKKDLQNKETERVTTNRIKANLLNYIKKECLIFLED